MNNHSISHRVFGSKEFGLVLFIVLLVASCSKKESTDLCEQKVVTFSTVVKPILQQNCYECHNNTTKSGYISLQDSVKVQELALSGKLYGVISHQPGYKFMPKDRPKIDTCSIAYIKQWIDDGAVIDQ